MGSCADILKRFSGNSYSPRFRLASAWRTLSILALPCFLGRCNLYTYAIFLDVKSDQRNRSIFVCL